MPGSSKKRLHNVFAVMLMLLCCFHQASAQGHADSLLDFIKSNPAKSSMVLQKNNTVIARLNENKVMPLASTVKIIVAIEFAKQAAKHVIDTNTAVALSELEKYYLPNTDGNAHAEWLKYEKSLSHTTNDSARLIDVARGMIMFSSNANTEYLTSLLGLKNVNSNIQLFGLVQHTIIYPLVSSLFIYQNPRGLKEEKILKEIQKLKEDEYVHYTTLIHAELQHDSTYKSKFRPIDLTLPMQKLWSDRLPASTTNEYVKIASVLNNRKYFDSATYHVLGRILETVMENPLNQEWLDHSGMKSGSTLFVLTKTLYATLKNGNKVELAYFFNNLSGIENYKLQKWMNDFDLAILTDDKFLEKIQF